MGGYRIKVHHRDEHREEREVPVKIHSQSGSEAAKDESVYQLSIKRKRLANCFDD